MEESKIPFGSTQSRDVFNHNNLYPSKESTNKPEGRLNGLGWACGICGKRFRTLFYLDRHYEKRHSGGKVNKGECVSDMCNLVGCSDVKSKNLGYYETEYGPGIISGSLVGGGNRREEEEEKGCDDIKMAGFKNQCRELIDSCVSKTENIDTEVRNGRGANATRCE